MTRTTIRRPGWDDWLALRMDYLGASEVAALFDAHPWLTAGDLAVLKLTREAQPETDAMRRGQRLEAMVADLWAAEHGLTLLEPRDLFVYDDTVMATLDRIVREDDSHALEIKTVAGYVNDLEPHWWWQCQAQILCADLNVVTVVCLDSSLEIKTWIVEPDDTAAERIIAAAGPFLRAIRAGEMPPVTTSYKNEAALNREVTGEVVALDAPAMAAVAALVEVKAAIKKLEDDKDELQAIIARALGGATEGRYDGHRVVTWNPSVRTDLDRERLRAEHPELVAEYAKLTTLRTMRTY